MQIVIDIEEKIFAEITKYDEPIPSGNRLYDSALLSIYNGVPLPKHHGRLKDVDWIDENCKNYYSDIDGRWCYAWRDIDEAPTIIEADKE